MAMAEVSLNDEGDANNKPAAAEGGADSWKILADYAQRQLSPKEKKDFEELIKNANRIRILVTGKTGIGKSTLLNGLIGKKVFETGRANLDCVTKNVDEHKHTFHERGVEIIVFDSPGFHDGLDNEKEYVEEMVKKITECGGVDLILYCKRMDTAVADIDKEKMIIKKLQDSIGDLVDDNGKKIGKDIWKRCLFVLTFANVYEKSLRSQGEKNVSKDFNKRIEEWKGVFKAALNGSGIHVPIRVCVAGYKQPKLCESEHWVSDFWAATFEVLIDSETGALSLLRLSHARIVEAPTESSQEPMEPEDHKIVLTEKLMNTFEKYAAGAGVAGGVGAVTGAAVGATIGAVGIGVLSFGPAAGAGLIIGGAIGAVVGSAVGGGILKVYHRHKFKKEQRQREIENRFQDPTD